MFAIPGWEAEWVVSLKFTDHGATLMRCSGKELASKTKDGEAQELVKGALSSDRDSARWIGKAGFLSHLSHQQMQGQAF